MINPQKIFIYLLCLLLIVVGVVYYLHENNKTIPMPVNCEHFNGREFLLSGGSVTPQTLNDVNKELGRLKWLCEGGKS